MNPYMTYEKDGIMMILPQYDTGVTSKETVYSDRLWQWDPKKHDSLCQKHFDNKAQHWGNRDPKKIESFLCEYTGRKIELCRIEEYEHKITGYPYWRFDFNYTEPKNDPNSAGNKDAIKKQTK